MSFSLFASEDHPLIKPVSSLRLGWNPLTASLKPAHGGGGFQPAPPKPSKAPGGGGGGGAAAHAARQAREDAAVARLAREAAAFMLASHLRWALWAACMSANPATSEFGYLEYGLARLAQYYALKAAGVAADGDEEEVGA